MKKKKSAVNAAKSEVNRPKVKTESPCENCDSINKWWLLKQGCKGVSVALACAAQPYLSPMFLGRYAWALKEDVKSGKHRKDKGFSLSTTSSLWDDILNVFF